eukprot:SAG22_NODE_668_length_7998_cov_4.353462_9_plen_27_part_01
MVPAFTTCTRSPFVKKKAPGCMGQAGP